MKYVSGAVLPPNLSTDILSCTGGDHQPGQACLRRVLFQRQLWLQHQRDASHLVVRAILHRQGRAEAAGQIPQGVHGQDQMAKPDVLREARADLEGHPSDLVRSIGGKYLGKVPSNFTEFPNPVSFGEQYSLS